VRFLPQCSKVVQRLYKQYSNVLYYSSCSPTASAGRSVLLPGNGESKGHSANPEESSSAVQTGAAAQNIPHDLHIACVDSTAVCNGPYTHAVPFKSAPHSLTGQQAGRFAYMAAGSPVGASGNPSGQLSPTQGVKLQFNNGRTRQYNSCAPTATAEHNCAQSYQTTISSMSMQIAAIAAWANALTGLLLSHLLNSMRTRVTQRCSSATRGWGMHLTVAVALLCLHTAGGVRTVVDLATWSTPAEGFRVWGAAAGDNFGQSSAGIGDINKDGYQDLAVADKGAVTVVFGSPARSAVSLDASSVAPLQGVKIIGVTTSGMSVAAAGDFNKDGIDDFMVGIHRYAPPSRADAGAVVLIFGKRTGWVDINLASFSSGNAGFWIWGKASSSLLGVSLGCAGDVNGDGFHDIVVGAHMSGYAGASGVGSAHVIFGRSNATAYSTIDLAGFASGSIGFAILGAAAGDNCGYAVSGAGDFNHDGYDDVLVGAPYNDGFGSDAGAVYIIFGHSTATVFRNISTASLLSGEGFVIAGPRIGAQLGFAVSLAGDFNLDGVDDVVIGARYAYPSSLADAGSAYVFFGRALTASSFSNVYLNSFAASSDGFRVDGAVTLDQLGFSLTGGADVNGDGVADVVLGAPYADPLGKSAAGTVYVLYGRSGSHADLNFAPGPAEQRGLYNIWPDGELFNREVHRAGQRLRRRRRR
jgi:hypothetical protein